jgi:hypothetical protein
MTMTKESPGIPVHISALRDTVRQMLGGKTVFPSILRWDHPMPGHAGMPPELIT